MQRSYTIDHKYCRCMYLFGIFFLSIAYFEILLCVFLLIRDYVETGQFLRSFLSSSTRGYKVLLAVHSQLL